MLHRLSSASSPSSSGSGTLVDKTTSTTFKTPTGVARRSTSSKSAGTSNISGNKQSQNTLMNGSPTNSDSEEGDDGSKQSKYDSDDEDKGGRPSSPSTTKGKRKRGRPPKDKKSSEQGSSGSKNSKMGNNNDPYDFDDDGNDHSGGNDGCENTANENDDRQSSTSKKNQWRVEGSSSGSCNLLQLNDATITKTEYEIADLGDQQVDSDNLTTPMQVQV